MKTKIIVALAAVVLILVNHYAMAEHSLKNHQIPLTKQELKNANNPVIKPPKVEDGIHYYFQVRDGIYLYQPLGSNLIAQVKYLGESENHFREVDFIVEGQTTRVYCSNPCNTIFEVVQTRTGPKINSYITDSVPFVKGIMWDAWMNKLKPYGK